MQSVGHEQPTLRSDPRSRDTRPLSRDYSRMNQPPQDYYPVVAGTALQQAQLDGPTADTGSDNSSLRSRSERGVAQEVRLSDRSTQASAREVNADQARRGQPRDLADQREEQRRSPSPDWSQQTPDTAATAHGFRKQTAREDSYDEEPVSALPTSPTAPSEVSGASERLLDRHGSIPISEPTPSDVSGSGGELHNPALETGDNEGLIPVDLSTVGGLRQEDVDGLMPVEHAEANEGDSFKTLRANNPAEVDPGRPRMRDFAKDYIRSIAGSSADTPGARTVPGGFPGAAPDPALR